MLAGLPGGKLHHHGEDRYRSSAPVLGDAHPCVNLWGGPPGPRPAPWPALLQATRKGRRGRRPRTGGSAPQGSRVPDTLIRNGTVVTASATTAADVLIEGERIKDVRR